MLGLIVVAILSVIGTGLLVAAGTAVYLEVRAKPRIQRFSVNKTHACSANCQIRIEYEITNLHPGTVVKCDIKRNGNFINNLPNATNPGNAANVLYKEYFTTDDIDVFSGPGAYEFILQLSGDLGGTYGSEGNSAYGFDNLGTLVSRKLTLLPPAFNVMPQTGLASVPWSAPEGRRSLVIRSDRFIHEFPEGRRGETFPEGLVALGCRALRAVRITLTEASLPEHDDASNQNILELMENYGILAPNEDSAYTPPLHLTFSVVFSGFNNQTEIQELGTAAISADDIPSTLIINLPTADRDFHILARLVVPDGDPPLLPARTLSCSFDVVFLCAPPVP